MSGIVVDGLRWEVRVRGRGVPLLLIHGFTGRGTAWGAHATAFARAFRVIAVDLPGHGRSDSATPERMTVERTADDLAEILDHLDAVPAHVLGYSLGARVALRLAVANPRVVRRLVLESASAGLATADERIARRQRDLAAATALEYKGMAAFVAEWESQPIFASHASLPAARAARLRAMRLDNDASGLAASLRGAGQGSMEPMHDFLPGVGVPTLVIAGAVDIGGRPRAEEVANGIPGARLEIVDGVGHTPHLEAPAAFRRLVLAFLEEPAA